MALSRLGAVEGGVGLGRQPGDPVGRAARHPGAETDRDPGVDPEEGLGVEALEELARPEEGGLGVGVGEDDGELVASEADGEVTGAGAVVEELGDADEDGVAGQVPVAVVDGLEEVDVEEIGRSSRRRAPGCWRCCSSARRLPMPVRSSDGHGG